MDVSDEKLSKDANFPTSGTIQGRCSIGIPRIIPLTNQKLQLKTTEAHKKIAYDLHCDVNGLQNNYAEDANSFFRGNDAIKDSPSSSDGASSIRVGTDCSGIEIPIIALTNIGAPFEHIFASDNDADVVKTIEANYKPIQIFGDISTRITADVPEVDVYVAGFPCQPFSTMGKQAGFDDARGTIFFNVLDYIVQKLPKVFILENVKGLTTIESGKLLNQIMRLLRSVRFHTSGKKAYAIKQQVLDTKELGIPHSRPRWYCVGIRKDAKKADSFAFPEHVDCPAIESFLDDESKDHPHDPIKQASKTVTANIHSAENSIKESGGNLQQPFIVDCDASRQKSRYTYNYSPCITRSRNRGHWLIHKNRRMTIREMMRLQGVDPVTFVQVVSDSVMGQQLGNAMSVNVIEQVMANVLLQQV